MVKLGLLRTIMNQSELLEYIHYNQETGLCFWKKKPSPKINVGDSVGYVSSDGYMYFGFKNKTLKLHRAIFLMLHGFLPKYVDHHDHDRLNNRPNNLRAATMTSNNRNCSIQKNNQSGIVGVSYCKKRNKWVAMIWHESKPISLGRFINKEDAINARKEAEVRYGYNPNHGK